VTPRNHHIGTLQGLTATTAVTLRDRCQGSDFASLSGNSGHGAIFGAHRSVVNDTLRTSATSRRQGDAYVLPIIAVRWRRLTHIGF
jgi:hypothetical protein